MCGPLVEQILAACVAAGLAPGTLEEDFGSRRLHQGVEGVQEPQPLLPQELEELVHWPSQEPALGLRLEPQSVFRFCIQHKATGRGNVSGQLQPFEHLSVNIDRKACNEGFH